MTISDEAAVIPEPLDDSTRITSEFGSPRKTIGLVLVAALGMYVMAMSMSTALSLRIASVAPDTKDVIYSRTVAIGALLMLVVIPLAGALSDRTTSRFGRRRPWIAGGLVVALVTALIAGISPNPIVIGASYVVLVTAMQSSFNAYAVIPVEAVPDAMRARVMGIMGLFGALAFSGGSYLTGALVGQPVLLMTAPVLLAVLTVAPLLALYRDPIKAKAEVPALDVKNLFGGLIVNPRKHPNFGWTWLARLLAGIAMASLFTYFIYYMIDVLQVPLPEVGAKAGLLTLISAPISVIFFTGSGWLSDKVGRRKPFVAVAAVLMAAALVLGASATSFVTFAIAWSIFAMGQAIYLTVDLALCASVLPNAKDAGKDMAVFGLALNIPNIIVPAVGPTVLALGGGQNYSLLWIAAAVLCLVGAGLMPLIRGVR
ncbi:MFS transporter [Demequina capsici]|uniref:MFS transporter n=1 Tax=Demequina capsici TaxID=3075620 RepID=A0AA96FAH9_9MICO|nr:MFS transporter [Demequina sp. PMTSA13]WNM26604.1 MFS transporter [Demequina sp. PMTSA13]